MEVFRFLKFPVYKKAREFYCKILLLTDSMTNLSLKDQIRRASLSIVLNIAEGSAKKSDKDFARFLEMSIGSANEVASCVDIMKSIKYISEDGYENIMVDCESISKQLGGFIKSLRVNS